jgi:hypothetical protein
MHERSAAARADRARAELDADTAIAVKRAEVRAATEILRAERELASARLTVEAQHEIDREQQRRRVPEALEAATPVQSERVVEPLAELVAQRPPTENLPALAQAGAVEPRRGSGTSLITGLPGIPDATRTAAFWIRPFVPPIVASAIETTTRPLRGVRQSFEETEEIHFTLKRSYKVTVQTEESGEQSAEGRPGRLVDPDANGCPWRSVRVDTRRTARAPCARPEPRTTIDGIISRTNFLAVQQHRRPSGDAARRAR